MATTTAVATAMGCAAKGLERAADEAADARSVSATPTASAATNTAAMMMPITRDVDMPLCDAEEVTVKGLLVLELSPAAGAPPLPTLPAGFIMDLVVVGVPVDVGEGVSVPESAAPATAAVGVVDAVPVSVPVSVLVADTATATAEGVVDAVPVSVPVSVPVLETELPEERVVVGVGVDVDVRVLVEDPEAAAAVGVVDAVGDGAAAAAVGVVDAVGDGTVADAMATARYAGVLYEERLNTSPAQIVGGGGGGFWWAPPPPLLLHRIPLRTRQGWDPCERDGLGRGEAATLRRAAREAVDGVHL